MVVASGRLAPLHIQCIRDCINIENKNLRRKTWIALAKSVSMLLEVSKDLKLLESAFSEEELKEFKQLVESYPPKSTVIDPVVRPGSTNLPEYASIATLPSMPWYPRYAGSPPYKQPNDKRNLRSVQQIPTTKFFKRVLSCKQPRVLTPDTTTQAVISSLTMISYLGTRSKSKAHSSRIKLVPAITSST